MEILASNDNYDPDRLQFDRTLRRYYINRGYADFKVLSAVASSPRTAQLYINFTVEGSATALADLHRLKIASCQPPAAPLVRAKKATSIPRNGAKGDRRLTNAAGTKGYAFAEVRPRIKRNPSRTIDLGFEIVQGRASISKRSISRQYRTSTASSAASSACRKATPNRVLIDRSRTRIRALGFFKEVDVKNVPGSQPDRTNLTVNVTEQSTASLQVGLGYSTTTSLLGEVSYTDTNWFGRGQNLRVSLQASYITKQALFSFTEPYFLDRELAAGFDIYQTQTNFDQATYQSNTTAATARLGFPISEFSSVSVSYTYKIEEVKPYAGAPLDVQLAAGSLNGSIFAFSYAFADLDDIRKPTDGASPSASNLPASAAT